MKKIKEIKTKKQLLSVLKTIPYQSKGHRNSIVCSLIGHSLIQTTCFGYFNCGRCGDQLGDSLGGTYLAAKSVVLIGHNCKICRKNYKKCTWKDKVYVKNPFEKS